MVRSLHICEFVVINLITCISDTDRGGTTSAVEEVRVRNVVPRLCVVVISDERQKPYIKDSGLPYLAAPTK